MATTTAACWLLAQAVAAQPATDEAWSAVVSGPIEVYTNARPAKAEGLLSDLEKLRAVLVAAGLGPNGAERRTEIYAFATEETLAPYTTAPTGGEVVNLGEYLIEPGLARLVLNAGEASEELRPWVYRVYLAQALPRSRPHLPYWLTSGLAQCFANVRSDNSGSVEVGEPDKLHLEVLRAAEWIDLGQFFRLTADSALLQDGRSREIFDAQSWLVAHYLLRAAHQPSGPQREILEEIEKGAAPEDAISQRLGQDLATFQRELTAYAYGDSARPFALAVEPTTADDYVARQVSADEIALRLGRYLVRTVTYANVALAERHLQPLVAGSPLAGDALAALAEMQHRTGGLGQARELYERAIAAGPKRAESFLGYASLLAETEGDLELRGQLLDRALNIDPNLGEVWLRLAETHLDEPAEYARHISRAVELEPERADLAYNLAVAHLRQGDTEAARQVIRERLRNTDQRELAEVARREIDRLERVAASNEALLAGDLATAIDQLRQARDQEMDPRARARIEEEIERLEARATKRAQFEAFNRAAALANDGRTVEASQILRGLLPEVDDEGLRATIVEVLGRIDPRADPP